MAGALRRFIPLFDRVLVQRAEKVTQTAGGIMIPEKAQNKMLEAIVVAVGPGGRTSQGEVIPPSVKVGDNVLLPEYGGTKLEIEEKEYHLFRDNDILGKFE